VEGRRRQLRILKASGRQQRRSERIRPVWLYQPPPLRGTLNLKENARLR
jgi:hypothetical protein